jgi:hypothetical protein
MTTIPMDAAIEQLRAVLREAFEGPHAKWSYFTDNAPDAGVLGSIRRLNSTEASRPLGGSTIASHVHHLTFALRGSSSWVRGNRTPLDWKESWRVSEVDDQAWKALVVDLRRAYQELDEAIERHAAGAKESMGEAMGATAHAACHLGAIRQKLCLLRGS